MYSKSKKLNLTYLLLIVLGFVFLFFGNTFLIKNNKLDLFNNFNNSKYLANYLEISENQITNLSLGIGHSGAVIKDNDGNDHLYMWGNNDYGQLGNGDSSGENVLTPIEINVDGWGENKTKGTISNLSLGSYHSGAVIKDNDGNDHLYMWGKNKHGQLGNGFSSTRTNVVTPTEINVDGGLEGIQGTISNLSLGSYHSGAVIKDNDGNDHLYMWGNNDYGQLGNGDSSGENVLTPIEINVDGWGENKTKGAITNLSLGDVHSGAVIKDNSGNDHLWMWGKNDHGQIGNGLSDNNVLTPTEINVDGGLEGIQGIITNLSLGGYHSGAVIKDNDGNDHLYMWGNDGNGQIGNGKDYVIVLTPTEINVDGGLEGIQGTISNLSLGSYHSGAVIKDNDGNDHLYMWGKNKHGQLGNGFSSTWTNVVTPTEINVDGGLEGIQGTITNLSLGDHHSGAVIKDNDGNDHLYMWGGNEYGQLGNGLSGSDVLTPIEITSTLSNLMLTKVENSVTISWNLIKNSSTKLNSLILTGTGVSETNEIDLTSKGFGENEYTINNLVFGNYNDWEITYLTNFGWGIIKLDSFAFIEQPKGDITINKPQFLVEGEAKFIVNISKLEGTTKIKDNQITINGSNITTQTFNLIKEDENNYSFIIKNLKPDTIYNLTTTYTLITDTLLDNVSKTKTLNFNTPSSSLSLTNLKIDNLDDNSVTLSWEKSTQSENIIYSIIVYDNKNSEIKRDETSNNTITINNLDYNKKYNFKIFAYDKDGHFWQSELTNINFKTKDLYSWSNYLIIIFSSFILIFIPMLIGLLIYKKKIKFS